MIIYIGQSRNNIHAWDGEQHQFLIDCIDEPMSKQLLIFSVVGYGNDKKLTNVLNATLYDYPDTVFVS